jgi:hypothetical protein
MTKYATPEAKTWLNLYAEIKAEAFRQRLRANALRSALETIQAGYVAEPLAAGVAKVALGHDEGMK